MTSDRDLRRRYALLHGWAERQVADPPTLPDAASASARGRRPVRTGPVALAAACVVAVLGAVALLVPGGSIPLVAAHDPTASSVPPGPPAAPSAVPTTGAPSAAPASGTASPRPRRTVTVDVGAPPPSRSAAAPAGPFRATVDGVQVDGRTVTLRVSATGAQARRRLAASCLDVALAGGGGLRRRAEAVLAPSGAGVAGTLTFAGLLPGPATVRFGCSARLGTASAGTVGRPAAGSAWWVTGGESTRPEGIGGTATLTRVVPGTASVTVSFEVLAAPDVPRPQEACLVVRRTDGTTLRVLPAATTVTEDDVFVYAGSWTFAGVTTAADLSVAYGCTAGWSEAPLGALG